MTMPPNEPRFSCGRLARITEFYVPLIALGDQPARSAARKRPSAAKRWLGSKLPLDLSCTNSTTEALHCDGSRGLICVVGTPEFDWHRNTLGRHCEVAFRRGAGVHLGEHGPEAAKCLHVVTGPAIGGKA
jgi:hypothetical protein